LIGYSLKQFLKIWFWQPAKNTVWAICLGLFSTGFLGQKFRLLCLSATGTILGYREIDCGVDLILIIAWAANLGGWLMRSYLFNQVSKFKLVLSGLWIVLAVANVQAQQINAESLQINPAPVQSNPSSDSVTVNPQALPEAPAYAADAVLNPVSDQNMLDELNPEAADIEAQLDQLEKDYEAQTGMPARMEPNSEDFSQFKLPFKYAQEQNEAYDPSKDPDTTLDQDLNYLQLNGGDITGEQVLTDEDIATVTGPFNGTAGFNSNCYRRDCPLFVYVSKSRQKMYLFVEGVLQNVWKVSTGLPGSETPNFDLHPNGRILDRYTSTKFPGGDYNGYGNMPFVVFLYQGYAIHGTAKSNWSKLGRKASHGCIRVHPMNAKYFNRLVRQYGIEDVWVTVQ
jgi:hypothetical protein